MTQEAEKKKNQDKKGKKPNEDSSGSAAARGADQEKGKKKKGSLRDNIESIAVAILLALVIRYLAIEAFKIPTGSMAPTLLGEHKAVTCQSCGWKFPLDNKLTRFDGARCPNCLSALDVWHTCPECNGDLFILGLKWIGLYTPWVWCTNCPFRSSDGLNRGGRGGNRILVNKVIYDFYRAHRWDVIVFLYPRVELVCKNPNCRAVTDEVCMVCGSTPSDRSSVGGPNACPACGASRASARDVCPVCGGARLKKNTKNFIKRLIGLPGERLEIKHGDICINGDVAKKPKAVQETLWQHVYDSRYVPKEKIVADKIWKTQGNGWQIDRNRFTVDPPSAAEPSLLELNRDITDEYGYSVARFCDTVGDLKLSCDVVPDGSKGFICATIQEDADCYRFLLRVGEEKGESVLMRSGEVVARNSEFSLNPFESCRVEFYNVDGRQSVVAGAAEVLSAECAAASDSPPAGRVAFGAMGCKAAFRNVTIKRDVYYTHGFDAAFPTPGMVIPEGYFFALGDNSPNSRDSRVWGCVPMKNLIGRAFIVFWPVSGIGGIN